MMFVIGIEVCMDERIRAQDLPDLPPQSPVFITHQRMHISAVEPPETVDTDSSPSSCISTCVPTSIQPVVNSGVNRLKIKTFFPTSIIVASNLRLQIPEINSSLQSATHLISTRLVPCHRLR